MNTQSITRSNFRTSRTFFEREWHTEIVFTDNDGNEYPPQNIWPWRSDLLRWTDSELEEMGRYILEVSKKKRGG